MFNDNSGPLMFINSVQTSNNNKSGQQVYDSRNPIKVIKKEEKKEILLKEEEINLMKKIITLSDKDLKVNCEFFCNDKVFVGVPILINENTLKIENEGVVDEIELFDVIKFMIC